MWGVWRHGLLALLHARHRRVRPVHEERALGKRPWAMLALNLEMAKFLILGGPTSESALELTFLQALVPLTFDWLLFVQLLPPRL